jgi:transcription-repair coupling factor (superfamily II helicase)
VRNLVELLDEQRTIQVRGVPGLLKAWVTAHLVESGRRVLWIAERSQSRETALSDLSQLLTDDEVGLLPAPGSNDDITPFEARIFRARALQRWTSSQPYALITEPTATWLNLLPEKTILDRNRVALKPGTELGRDSLAEKLVEAGFSRCDIVENRGDYALRGHILDLFPYTHDKPLRLEYWGERLESLRIFDPVTQRTISHLKEENLFLASLEDNGHTNLTSYLLPSDVVFLEEPEEAALKVNDSPAKDIWNNIVEGHPVILWGSPNRDVPRRDFRAVPQEDFGGQIRRLADGLTDLTVRGTSVFISCENEGQMQRVKDLLSEQNIDPLPHLFVAHLSGGFRLPEGALALYTDHQIFRRPRRRRTYFRLHNFSPIERPDMLRLGDFVVHEEYGIGRYRGLKDIKVGGHTRECLHIEYKGSTTLYVRLESLKKIQKYSGREGFHPPLTRIGGGEWARIRKRAKKAVKQLATDLVKLYAVRSEHKGFPFQQDDSLQLELEAGFEFEETPDQLKAIYGVKRDMEQPRPMDRLVCGDVGYGKTEVALRAAFKAVISGRQVGILVPTTLLANQHYQTFSSRLSDSPIELEMLSRFRTPLQQRDILKRLKEGKIDVIVGTHRLLSKDVEFHNLGLLIVDEEHRFGVRHKERIKSMRSQIDVLTLTATPIPRTLHMALIGARDMSLIHTVPQDRLPIETDIAPFSKELIIDAVLREIDRRGQVYFVHNRIESIDAIREMLERWLPQIRFVVGHGQMPEKQLESTMNDFLNRKYDCLISTMIIESGLDLPNVNTMIVNRADRFGLAQLYQLRGRIGRSNRQAYAYLLTPPNLSVSDPARKRLDAIRDCSYLGAGYQLAMHDLEIRGAGEIFGAKQSGFLHSVGFDLYQRMLSEAIGDLKVDSNIAAPSETAIPDFEPKIEFPFDAFLPTDYIERPEQRLELYRQLSSVQEYKDFKNVISDTVDRYGNPPQQAQSLFDLVELKIGCVFARLPRLELQDDYLLAEISAVNGEEWRTRLEIIVAQWHDQPIEFSGADPPRLIIRWDAEMDWRARINHVKHLLKKIS